MRVRAACDQYAAGVSSRALNTNIFGATRLDGTGWRAARDLKRRDIGGKTGTTNSSKDAWFLRLWSRVVTSVWTVDAHRRDLGRTTASGAIKDQILRL